MHNIDLKCDSKITNLGGMEKSQTTRIHYQIAQYKKTEEACDNLTLVKMNGRGATYNILAIDTH